MLATMTINTIDHLTRQGSGRPANSEKLLVLLCRSRQSAITTELIEIISGAAALEG